MKTERFNSSKWRTTLRSVLVVGTLIAGALAVASLQPSYKIFFVNSSNAPFNPEQDILHPTAQEKLAEDVRVQVTGAALKSTLPFLINTADSTGGSLQEKLLLMASNLQTEVSKGVKASAVNAQILPLTHSFLLIPALTDNNDLFYSADKVSMGSGEIANVLTLVPGHRDFDTKLTEALNAAREKRLLVVPGSHLLAARSDITVESTSKSLITLQVLLALDAVSSPFKEENEKVKFQTLVIPKNEKAPPAALLTFQIEASAKPASPTLDVELGSFEKYENGKFLINGTAKTGSVPRLEGIAAKAGLKWVAVQIEFSRLKFDLAKLALVNINTITRPGLKLGGSSFVVGGFHVSSVDSEFQSEINKKIDAEVQTAIQKGKDKVDSQLMSKNVIEQLLKKVLE